MLPRWQQINCQINKINSPIPFDNESTIGERKTGSTIYPRINVSTAAISVNSLLQPLKDEEDTTKKHKNRTANVFHCAAETHHVIH